MAVQEKYFIEDLGSGETLNTDDSWDPFTPQTPARAFGSRQEALDHINNIANGSYRIYVRIVKS